MMERMIRTGKSVLPSRARRWLGRRVAPWTVARWRRASERAWDLTGGRIVAGPFEGMHYVQEASGSSLPPKLLGTYEMELRAVIDGVRFRGYEQIVDIGGGEGYYAVGLSLRCPQTPMIAYESSDRGRTLIAELAECNGARGRIDIRGACTASSLGDSLAGARPSLVICDIEGGEATILDPQAAPGLSSCDVLVELHERESPGVSELIRGRFESTHVIEAIGTRRRRVADVPAGLPGFKFQHLGLLDELRRDQMTWYWMTRRGV